MPTHNMWLSMSDDFKDELWPYVKWHGGQKWDDDGNPIPEPIPTKFPEIASINQVTVDFFLAIHDAGAIERLFKPWDAAGRKYRCWSFYVDKPEDITQIRADIDHLTDTYGQDFSPLGAWRYSDGAEVGGMLNEWYPIPPQTINFMPDVLVDSGGEDGDPPPIYEPATELTDVNLLFGQHPRDFTSYYGGASPMPGGKGNGNGC